jgi:hypothetical protein
MTAPKSAPIGGQPAHVVLVVAAELALGEVEQRATGEGHDGVALGRALRVDGVVGHRTDATGHVGHAHRVGDVLAFHQRALRQLAGQVEAAAGLGGAMHSVLSSGPAAASVVTRDRARARVKDFVFIVSPNLIEGPDARNAPRAR